MIDRWMDGLMNWYTNKLMEGWIDERNWLLLNRWINGWMDGWMDGLINGWIDGWMDGLIDVWRDGLINGWMKGDNLAECLRHLTWVQKVPGSSPEPSERWRGGHGNWVDAKLTVETQEVKAENAISGGRCVIPLGKGLVPNCSVVRMGLLTEVYSSHTCIRSGTEIKDAGIPPKVVP